MALPINYAIDSFLHGVNGFGAQFCTINFSSTLAANTEATVAVPNTSALGAANNRASPMFLAVFSYHPGRNVWVSVNATAAVPAGNTLVASTSELNPPAKVVSSTDVIHMICATATTDVGVSFYALPEA